MLFFANQSIRKTLLLLTVSQAYVTIRSSSLKKNSHVQQLIMKDYRLTPYKILPNTYKI